jgi:putative membrane protein
MKINNFLMAALCFGVLTVQSCNSDNKGDAKKEADQTNKDMKVIDNDDSKFMTEAASGGMMEVKAAQIAGQRCSSNQVKDFAKEMITDHTKANGELRDLAKQKNVALPDSMSNDDQKNIDKLMKEDAKHFDKTYIDMMVDDHKKAVDAFQKVVDNPKDADVKIWADKTLPTLKHHLEMAKMAKDNADKMDKKMK